ncbi:MAG: hypothetical protein U9Q79_10100, partial [Candidatus Hydrogenedentes bacterium]|nr:hypothetical protein [Candidatus Hydrogenedentota bacterium]
MFQDAWHSGLGGTRRYTLPGNGELFSLFTEKIVLSAKFDHFSEKMPHEPCSTLPRNGGVENLLSVQSRLSATGVVWLFVSFLVIWPATR